MRYTGARCVTAVFDRQPALNVVHKPPSLLAAILAVTPTSLCP